MEKGKNREPVITTLVKSLFHGEDEPIFDATAFYDWDFHEEMEDELYGDETEFVVGV